MQFNIVFAPISFGESCRFAAVNTYETIQKMQRRSFLKSIFVGTGLIVAAPAIVKAESLMKIFVPRQTLVADESPMLFQGIEWQRPGLYPPEPIIGSVYFNTLDKLVYCYTGKQWMPLAGVPHAT